MIRMAKGSHRRFAYLAGSLAMMVLCVYVALAVLGRGFNFDGQVQLAAKRYGAHGQQTMVQWRNLMRSLETSQSANQVEDVNAFINSHVTFTEDSVGWGQSDYWATPLETLGRGIGDCEDYAIAKYFSLRACHKFCVGYVTVTC